ncbi:putative pyridoxal kinase C6F6.11c [Lasiodiplodia hormozganensis]|uniref:pyridoxal kinase n=1 Tax=Lasiodiplodia hormozganensis TaxID=869390 RepID=A0AA39Z0G0_9PEZI|nr:putative pyridoxal kinase C6F6.11c [Lasiodiplodia hormozganensis]
MSREPSIPETRVLAIASHVVHGYVGNKMATFIMQALGCEVSAINTVHYSNHTAYRQVKGRKTTADEILELYEGLKQSDLNNFDVLLSGYMPSAEAVQAVGKIGRDLRFNASVKPGSFFWVLDPVMGDQGRCYVPEDEIPQYKTLLREADLILPNQFEAELLSDTKITNLTTLATAIQRLHSTYHIPHIIITSLRLSPDDDHTILPPSTDNPTHLTVVGSTATSTHAPRLFRLDAPAFPHFFSGTGDMFAALTVARLREACAQAGTLGQPSWRSADDVRPAELPLARATEKVLESMHVVLGKTAAACEEEMARLDEEEGRMQSVPDGGDAEAARERTFKRHLRCMRASEVRVVRNVGDLLLLGDGSDRDKFVAREVLVDGWDVEAGKPKPDQLGVTDLGVGASAGAVQVETA